MLCTLAKSQLISRLVATGRMSDPILCELLSHTATALDLTNAASVRNSVLRSLGYACPRLTYLNLSNCGQVNNAVVRSVLQGCASLRQLYLNNCRRVSDSGFNVAHSPFALLVREC